VSQHTHFKSTFLLGTIQVGQSQDPLAVALAASDLVWSVLPVGAAAGAGVGVLVTGAAVTVGTVLKALVTGATTVAGADAGVVGKTGRLKGSALEEEEVGLSATGVDVGGVPKENLGAAVTAGATGGASFFSSLENNNQGKLLLKKSFKE